MVSRVWSRGRPFGVMLVFSERERRGRRGDLRSLQPYPGLGGEAKPIGMCHSRLRKGVARSPCREPRTCARAPLGTSAPADSQPCRAGTSRARRSWEAGQMDGRVSAAARRAGAGGEGRVKGMWKPPAKRPAVQHLFRAEPLGLEGGGRGSWRVVMGVRLPYPFPGSGGSGAGRACAAAWHGAGRSSRLQLAPGREEPDLVSCD